MVDTRGFLAWVCQILLNTRLSLGIDDSSMQQRMLGCRCDPEAKVILKPIWSIQKLEAVKCFYLPCISDAIVGLSLFISGWKALPE